MTPKGIDLFSPILFFSYQFCLNNLFISNPSSLSSMSGNSPRQQGSQKKKNKKSKTKKGFLAEALSSIAAGISEEKEVGDVCCSAAAEVLLASFKNTSICRLAKRNQRSAMDPIKLVSFQLLQNVRLFVVQRDTL